MALEKILTDGSENGQSSALKINTSFDAIDQNTLALNGTQFITESITKTVGVGKDFELFHDAMIWAIGIKTSKGSNITLLLDDGVHRVGEPDQFNQSWWTYYAVTQDIFIKSASGIRDNCIITLPPTDDGENWPSLFNVLVGGKITFYQIVIDPIIDGYPYPQTVSCVIFSNLSMGYIRDTKITNGWSGIESYEGVEIFMFSRTHGNIIENCDYGILCQSNNITMNSNSVNTIINNCDKAIELNYASTISVVSFSGGQLLLTNNINDGVVLNEIQYDGSYISDGTSPLQQKGLEVITESVTKTVGVGKDFETLHLALRWAEKITQEYGQITLSLDDGVHVLGGQNEVNPSGSWTYYDFLNKDIYMNSASYNASLCSVTLDGWDDGENWYGLMQCVNSSLTSYAITWDMSLDGYPYPQTIEPLFSRISRIGFIGGKIAQIYGLSSTDSTLIQLGGMTIDNTEAGVQAISGGKIKADDCIFSNNKNGINVRGNSSALATDCTFTNNTTDTNIPLNEIQEDGSYISDGTESLHFKGIEYISGSVDITVGSGKDFETLDEALQYVETLRPTQEGNVNVIIDDGIHTLKNSTEIYDWWWCFYVFRIDVYLKSASGIQANCIITMDATDDGDNYPFMFATGGALLTFNNITIDPSAGGYPYPQNVSFGYGTISNFNSTFKIGEYYISNTSEVPFTQGCTFDDVNLFLYNSMYIRNSTIKNCTDTAITVSLTGRGALVNLENVTFTNNAVDTNIPLNEIQFNGSLIANGLEPISVNGALLPTGVRTPKGAMNLVLPNSQSLNDTTYVPLEYDQIVINRGGVVPELAGGTITIPKTDSYEFDLSVDADFQQQEQLDIMVFVNGVAVSTEPLALQGQGNGKPNAITWNTTYNFNAGDVVYLGAKNGDAGNLTVNFRRLYFALKLDI